MSLKYPTEPILQGVPLSNSITTNSKNKKAHFRLRKDDILWTLEEEFLFFEMHLHIGNKWSKYVSYFHNKTSKDLKNHFHACIIKTVRRIVKNKYDCNQFFILTLCSKIVGLKDIIRNFYCFNYLLDLFSKETTSKIPLFKTSQNSKGKNSTNTLIRNNNISFNSIEKYKTSYLNKLLQTKHNMVKLFKEIGYDWHNNENGMKLELMRWFFYINIKTRLLKKSMKVIEEGVIKDKESLGILCDFVKENFYLESLYESLFND